MLARAAKVLVVAATPATLALAKRSEAEGDALGLLQVKDRAALSQQSFEATTGFDLPDLLREFEPDGSNEEEANELAEAVGGLSAEVLGDQNKGDQLEIPTEPPECADDEITVDDEAQTEQFLEGLDDDRHCKDKKCGWWTMKTRPNFYAKHGIVDKSGGTLKEVFHKPLLDLPMAQGKAADVAQAMFTMTEIHHPVKANAPPREFRGVYWRNGSDFPEELITMQYAAWSGKTLVIPTSPYTRAWPVGKPDGATDKDKRYSKNHKAGIKAAAYAITPGMAESIKFKGETKDTYGQLQYHYAGNMEASFPTGIMMFLQNNIPLPLNVLSGSFRLKMNTDEAKSENDGDVWDGEVHIGLGTCLGKKEKRAKWAFNLLRIIDADGKPTKYMTDFQTYMGDVELMTWMGFKSQFEMSKQEKKYKEAAAAPTPWYAPLPWMFGFRR